MPSPVQPIFPALYLYPLNDSFIPKHISLAHGQRVKIGRQTNAKTAPAERNGYFDSKVLSRQHAEVWEEGGKIFIKDVKSSNGTFINGDRLSPESLESDPHELKNDDIVEFGIDIVGDDNKTIIHHKVAARVYCVFNEQDVQVATLSERQPPYQMPSPGPSQPAANQIAAQPNGAGSSFPFGPGQQRRPQLAQQGLAGMGGMGGGLRAPGKSGLTFEHLYSRIQVEAQKSRETGSELIALSGLMNEIHDTLGGTHPSTLPSYPSALPPVRAPAPLSQEPSPSHPPAVPPAGLTSSALADLQSKLLETQSSLSTHVDKIRALEGVFAEQEALKREVHVLREMMETKRREAEVLESHEPRGGFDDDDEIFHEDDDDARSIRTIIPHELERVEEEDEEQLARESEAEMQPEEISSSNTHEEENSNEEAAHAQTDHDLEAEHEQQALADEDERRRRNDELGRPRTPEPTNLGLRTGSAPRRSSPSSPLTKVAASSTAATETVFNDVLEKLGSLMTLTSSLEAQHAAAQSTISALENKVQTLEAAVKAAQDTAAAAQAQAQAIPPPVPAPIPGPSEERESLTVMFTEWKNAMEQQWGVVRQDWDKERERLSAARTDWEGQVRGMETGFEKLGATATALKVQQEQMEQQQREQQSLLDQQRREQQQRAESVNGDAKSHIHNAHGLVTPPSPRSLSSDSTRSRRRARRGRRSRSMSSGSGGEADTDTDATLASEESPPKGTVMSTILGSLNARVKQEHVYQALEEEDGDDTVLGVQSSNSKSKNGAETLATPESSVYIPSKPRNGSAIDAGGTTTKSVTPRERDYIQLQTAIGVVVLGVAAAAVLWRVKPQT